MTDFDHSDGLPEKQRRNRQQRLERVKRWANYVRDEPPEVWGPQQNAVVDSQLESARETDLPVEHLQAIRGFGDAAPGDHREIADPKPTAEDT